MIIIATEYSKTFKKVSKAPIQKLTRSFNNFTKTNSSSGIIVIFTVIIALIIANSVFRNDYFSFLKIDFIIGFENIFGLGDILIEDSVLHWINDGLMTIFFFLIGLEIKREILIGELNSLKHALFPFIGAIGGMAMPAIVFLIFNPLGTQGSLGWAIPTATDIAFSLVVLSLLGTRIPFRLKIFLTTLAIFDDIGAIIVIAIFYTETILWEFIFLALIALGLLIGINRFGFRSSYPYLLLGLLLWFFLFESGIHATIGGVLLAFTIPATTRIDMNEFKVSSSELMARIYSPGPEDDSIKALNIQLAAVETLKQSCNEVEAPLRKLEHSLAPWVAFAIVPIFAFANSGIAISGDIFALLLNPITLGCFFGLLIGKPLGIFGAVYFSSKLKLVKIPYGIDFKEILGVGFVAGIGFTMSFLIANLSFTSEEILTPAKLGILLGSLLAAIIGILILLQNSDPKIEDKKISDKN